MTALEYAQEYASRGWAVFPVHGIRDGKCTCGDADCSSPGKHPIHSGGFKNATTKTATIEAWWKTIPDANIGIATGSVSDLLVVDIDRGNGKDGFASLKALEEEFGDLPMSLRVRTGSGGLHIYMRMPDQEIRCSTSRLAPSIDVRADGGYVVAPPSTHISGKNYSWENSND
jgi:putative DNA primase/helicase